MPYIGKQLVRGQNRKLDDISSGFNGSQTTFTLQIASQNVSVGSALQLWISVGGVIQNPLTDFTIAGNQITFTTAPAASLDFFGVIQGDVTDTNTPGDATVTTSKLATGLTVNLADGSAATSSLQLGGTDSGLFSSAADKVNVTTGGVERLEIGSSEVVFNDGSNDVDFRVESNGQTHMLFVDGGNDVVGIGTSAPGDYSSSANDLVIAGSGQKGITIASTDSNQSSVFFADATSGTGEYAGYIAYLHSSDALTFASSGSEAMRIDSSGRLLVGTSTARANFLNGSVTALTQVEGSGSGTGRGNLSLINNASTEYPATFVIGRSNANTIGSNTLVNDDDWCGRIAFSGNDGSEFVELASVSGFVDGTPGANDMPGRLVFSTCADGASSPTERMRIDSSGRFFFNESTSDLGHKYILSGNESADVAAFQYNGNTGTYLAISTGAPNGNVEIKADARSGSFPPLTFKTGANERMRIDSSGNVGIGTSSPAAKLDIAGNQLFSAANPQIQFNAGGPIIRLPSANTLAFFTDSSTERMRISSGGEVLINRTNTTVNSSNFGTRIGGAGTSIGVFVTSRNTGTGGDVAVFYGQSGQLQIKGDGDCENTNTRYTGISDVKLKENIVDASSQWDDIKALQVRNYNFKEETGYGTHTQLGLVAQEVETICPGLVSESNDTDDQLNETGTVTKSVAYSVLYMKAVKALQEAIAKIETLETKVAALEAG